MFSTANGKEIPRIIITPTSALPDRSVFVVNNITFPIQQGADDSCILTEVTVTDSLIDNTGKYLVDNNGTQLGTGGTTTTCVPLLPRIDLSTSSDGGITFGNPFGITLNNYGNRRNILKFYNLGRYNEIIFQFRFWGMSNFVLTNGVAEVSQQ
jgi:hypothetical protein